MIYLVEDDESIRELVSYTTSTAVRICISCSAM